MREWLLIRFAARHGVVAVVRRGEQFLVIRRSQHVRRAGMHCFPGGTIEPGESEADAVRREMREELRLVGQPRRLLWRSVTPWNVELAWWLSRSTPLPEAQAQSAGSRVVPLADAA